MYTDSRNEGSMKTEVIFQKEISYIKNKGIQEDAIYLLSLLPEYFFHEPASSTGKYHPKYSLGEGGLLRHTKAAVRFAYEILQDPTFGNSFQEDEKDILLLALLLHDGFKKGKVEEKYTRFDHPLVVVEVLKEHREKLKMSENLFEILTSSIATHMGPWTKDYFGKEVLEEPKSKYQKFVHLCDYLASRKCFLLQFNEKNEILAE